MKSRNLNVALVANGYMVQSGENHTSAYKEIYVFESFESLAKWLKKTFSEKDA